MSLLVFIIVVSFILWLTIPNFTYGNPTRVLSLNEFFKYVLVAALIIWLLASCGWIPELLTYHIGKA